MSTFESEFTDIAIIGMACRFPGAKTPRQFWDYLVAEKELVHTFNEKELKESGINEESYLMADYVTRGAVLDDVEYFDADFFEFTPNDAKLTDPQQRVFLECAWEALEVSGYPSSSSPQNIGVYGSMSPSTYLLRNISQSKEYGKDVLSYPVMLGNDKDFLCTRVSYKLNLTGPSMSIQTACSSSLVAVHAACQSLINGECEMALAGGVSITVPQHTGYLYKEGGTLSKDGSCRAFDDKATGTVKGNGCGIILLKPLEKALEDRDTIHTIIKSTAINNDGRLKIGFTAPSPSGQAKAIREAIELAGIAPEDIEYIETHGTGTSLGDPIEIKALTDAFSTDKKQFCAIGSVKPNIGHLDAAAGIANVIKTTMVLKENIIPRSIHYETPNKKIDFENSPFYVNQSLQRRSEESPITYAGVSSLGMGGTNAHAILQKGPQTITEPQSGPYLLVLSGKTEDKVNQLIEQLHQHIETHPEHALSDIAYTLAVGRKEFDTRTYLIFQGKGEVLNGFTNKFGERMNKVSEADLKPYAFSISATATRWYYRQLYNELSAYRCKVNELIQLVETTTGLKTLKMNLLESVQEDFNSSREDVLVRFICLHAFVKLLMDLGIRPTKIYCNDPISDYIAASVAEVCDTDTVIDIFVNKLYDIGYGKTVIPKLPRMEVIASGGRKIQEVISDPHNDWMQEWNVSASRGVSENRLDKEVTMISVPFVDKTNSPAVGFLDCIGTAWTFGTTVDWSLLYQHQAVGRIPLPTYPFDKKRFWIDFDSNEGKEKLQPSGDIQTENKHSIEEQMTDIWKKCLDIEDIHPDDDFFLNLDGDSLTSIEIISDIKSQLNVNVSLEDFMVHSTLNRLIEHTRIQHQTHSLFNPASNQTIWKIKEGTYPENLFLIHPAGGTIMVYYQMAGHLKEHPSLYGIQFPAELLDSPFLSIEQLAKRYVSEIRKVQPKGPYLIGGYSFGGNVALEVALQLQNTGEQVSNLIMIDSFVPSTYNSQNIDREHFLKAFPIMVNTFFKPEMRLDENTVARLEGQSLDEMVESFYHLNVIPKAFAQRDVKQFFEIWCMNIQMLQKYRPQKQFDGNVLMFDAVETEASLHQLMKYLGTLEIRKEEWKDYLTGNWNVVRVPGNHYSIFSTAANLQMISREIEKSLSLVAVPNHH
ncbi:acyl transferase domain-containing protein/thioesterase domain-containing protein [Bacillus fengqiuensis]|nr:acyl transferase domain-containing protein/thioesterase domain-containing protein [Bacillus fengqiuensis]